MATENIKLRKRNFTADQGYFYVIEEDRDNLLQKTADGNTSFSYPLDTLLSTAVLSLEFDGVNFWSLEQSSSYIVVLRRWKVDNYICKLQQTITLTSGTSHYYNAEAFSVEHYHDTLASGVSVSGTTIYLTTYGDNDDLMNYRSTTSGTLKLHLGPNSSDEEEDVYVNTMVSGGGVTLISGTQYAYDQYDPVNFYTNLWLFNNYNGTSSSTGALYKIDPYNGTYVKKYPGGAYSSIKSSTFYKVDSFTDYGDVDTLAFVKSTNLLFIDVSQEVNEELRYYGSMVMGNIQSDEATVLSVYDLAMDGQNVYRLQKGPDAGTGETWTYYSYELSSLDHFVTSISLNANPAIIAANGVTTSTITAIVRDQFLQPISGRLVYFTDDNATGSIVTSPVNTSDGVAQTSYKSGTDYAEVKITATVSQS